MADFFEQEPWTEDDLKMLRELNTKIAAKELSIYAAIRQVQFKIPWRSLESIRAKMYRLRVVKGGSNAAK